MRQKAREKELALPPAGSVLSTQSFRGAEESPLTKLVVTFMLSMLVLTIPRQAAAEQQAVRGITEPYHDVTLSVSVPGTVSQVFKKEGDTVRAREEILELDKDLESLEVQRRQQIWQSTVELDEARQRLEACTRLLASTRELYHHPFGAGERPAAAGIGGQAGGPRGEAPRRGGRAGEDRLRDRPGTTRPGGPSSLRSTA